MTISGYHGTVTEEVFSTKNHFIYSTESAKFPIIKLSFSKSFGPAASKSQRNEYHGAADEEERVRKN